jgi:mRNA interferase MazF
MKDFDGWNSRKKNLERKSFYKFYKEREIWWCALGLNVGFEVDGKSKEFLRPVLIIKGLSRETCLIAPLTTSKRSNPLRINIGNMTGKEAQVSLSQIRVIDIKRLVEKIVIIDQEKFLLIKKSLRDFL